MSQVCLLHHCERGAAQHTRSGTLRGTQAWAHLHAQCTIRSPRSSSAAFVRAAHVARGRIAGVTAAVACTRRVRRPCDEAAHHQRGDGARAHTAPRDGPAVWEEFCGACARIRDELMLSGRTYLGISAGWHPSVVALSLRHRTSPTRRSDGPRGAARRETDDEIGWFLVHALLNNARTSALLGLVRYEGADE